MLFFGLTVAAGVLALLGIQKLDIEGVNPPAPKRVSKKRKAAAKSASAGGYVAGAAFLRQQ
jgi:hypothetical protein